MIKDLKRCMRNIVIRMISLYTTIRLKFSPKSSNSPKIIFINVNNYPDNFSKILKNFNISQNEVYNVQDKWVALLVVPDHVLQAIINADIIVTVGESPIFEILRKEQQLVFLWHACGAFKLMGSRAKAYKSRKPNWLVVSSESVRHIYADSFGMEPKQVKGLGIPRTEVLQDKEKVQQIKDKLRNKYPQLCDKKIYLYAPTYRDQPFRSEIGFDFEQMSMLLADDEVLIYKQHPAIILQCKKHPHISNFYSTHNILDMNNENILELTMLCDIMITDYSSAFFEAMLLDKPCVFCADDIDMYEKGYYIDYRKDLPGIIIEDGEAKTLLDALRTASTNHPNYQKFKEFHIGACKGNITQRVSDFINEVNNA